MSAADRRVNDDRRRFLGAAAMTIAAARFSAIDAGGAPLNQAKASAPTPDAAPSFGALKQIEAGVLNIGYADVGPDRRSAGGSSPRLALRHP